MAIPPDRNMHSDKASTSTNEGRKSSKPIMEKRRRARINASLTELKTLLLEVKKTEGSRHGKMEKADILEMTVKHLRQLQRQQFTGSPKTDSNVLNNYRLGFDECAQEVTRYLSQMDISDVNLRTKILDHLASCVSSGIFNPSPPSTPVSSAPPSVSPQCQTSGSSPQLQIPPLAQIAPSPSLVYSQLSPEQQPTLQTLSATATQQSIPSSNAVQMANVINTVQLIPTKLHTGEIAFVMPNTVLSNSAPAPSYIIPVYPTGSSSSAVGLQTTQTAPTTTIAVPNMSVPTLPVVPTPQHVAQPPRPVSSTASSNQVLSASSGLSLPVPTIAPFHPNVSLFPQRPQPSPAQLLPLEPRPFFPSENNADRNIAQGREEPPQNREESMWRPW